MTLSLKKKLLAITLMTLVGGNVLRVVSPVNILTEIASPHPVYALEGYDAEYQLRSTFDFAYEDANFAQIQERMKDIDLNKEQVRKIRTYLAKRGAPLAAHAETFVRMADKYGLPYNLMPAISVIESGGGLHNYRPYNYAGMGGQSNAFVFSNYDEAIEKHAQILKKGYFDKGATTPEQIGKYYCYQCPTWGSKVQGVMNAIDAS